MKAIAAQELPQELKDIIARVIECADPERIILFGSSARNLSSLGNDVDILVVKEGIHRRELAARIYRALIGIDRAVDVVVVRPEDIEHYGHARGLVLEPALREGWEIYGGGATSSRLA